MEKSFNSTETYMQQETVQTPVSEKSRTVALILAIVLGTLGINRLYLGVRGGVGRLVRYIISMTMSGVVFGVLFIIMGISHGVMESAYYDLETTTAIIYTLLAVDYLALSVMIGLLIPNTIGAVKDIVRTARGMMTDSLGLPVTKW